MSMEDDELDRALAALGNPAGAEPLTTSAEILARAFPPPPPPPAGLAGAKLALTVIGAVTAGFLGGALVVGGLWKAGERREEPSHQPTRPEAAQPEVAPPAPAGPTNAGLLPIEMPSGLPAGNGEAAAGVATGTPGKPGEVPQNTASELPNQQDLASQNGAQARSDGRSGKPPPIRRENGRLAYQKPGQHRPSSPSAEQLRHRIGGSQEDSGLAPLESSAVLPNEVAVAPAIDSVPVDEMLVQPTESQLGATPDAQLAQQSEESPVASPEEEIVPEELELPGRPKKRKLRAEPNGLEVALAPSGGSRDNHVDLSIGLGMLPHVPERPQGYGMLAQVSVFHGFQTAGAWLPEVGASLELEPRQETLPSALKLQAEANIGYAFSGIKPSFGWTVSAVPVAWGDQLPSLADRRNPGAAIDPHKPEEKPPASAWQTGPIIRLLAGPESSAKLDVQVSLDLGFIDPAVPGPSVTTSGRLAMGVSIPFGKRVE